MPLADALVEWSALGKEAVIALIGGVGVVAAFGFALFGVARYQAAQKGQPGGSVALGVTMSALGGLFCLAAVVLGILAMIHKS